MGRAADIIADALAAEVKSRTGWDEAPGLYFIYLHGRGGGRCAVRQLPVPDRMWAADRPPRVLAGMAQGLGSVSGLLQSVSPEALHGVAFRCEMWCADGGMPGTSQRSEMMADAYAHRLHLRPDRREARAMWAVDRAGITYGIMQFRDDPEVRRQVHYPAARRTITGDIPAALHELVTALLGVEMPGT
jgi:hypothetical protein